MADFHWAIKRILKKTESELPVKLAGFLKQTWYLLNCSGTFKIATFALTIKSRNPKTIEEKILYKMCKDRNPALKIYTDKIRVRNFVTEKIGDGYLTQSYGKHKSLKNLERESLPLNFVVKANHGSGALVICWEGAPRNNKLPKDLSAITWQRFLIHPDDLDWIDLVNLTDKWMTLDYFWFKGKFPEWAYTDIDPCLLIEEVLTQNGELAEDYKFFMFNGTCEFIQVDITKFSQHKRNFYRPDWATIDATIIYPTSHVVQKPPELLGEMLEISSRISAGMDFIRVDLYDSDQGIKFGELTNYPGCGTKTMRPRKTSENLARNWKQDY